MLIIDSNSSNNQTIELVIPNNDDLNSVTLTSPILETTTGIYCRINVNNTSTKTQEVFTDNWCLEEV